MTLFSAPYDFVKHSDIILIMEQAAKKTQEETNEQLLKQKLSEAELVTNEEVGLLDSNELRNRRRKAKKQFKKFADNLGQKELFTENK